MGIRLDGLDNIEKELNKVAESLGVFRNTFIQYIHLRQCQTRANGKDWLFSAGFMFKENCFPKTSKDKEKILDAIQKTIRKFIEKNNCIYKGQTLYTQKLNICPNFPRYEAVVLFNLKNREEYAGCSPKVKPLLKKFGYKTQPDAWGFFEEECWGLAVKPKGNNSYELRNNTEYRCKYLPGASTRETEQNIIKAILVMAGCRKARHELSNKEVDALFTTSKGPQDIYKEIYNKFNQYTKDFNNKKLNEDEYYTKVYYLQDDMGKLNGIKSEEEAKLKKSLLKLIEPVLYKYGPQEQRDAMNKDKEYGLR